LRKGQRCFRRRFESCLQRKSGRRLRWGKRRRDETRGWCNPPRLDVDRLDLHRFDFFRLDLDRLRSLNLHGLGGLDLHRLRGFSLEWFGRAATGLASRHGGKRWEEMGAEMRGGAYKSLIVLEPLKIEDR